MQQMITYNISVNLVKNTRYHSNYQLRYERLSEADMKIVAGWYLFKKSRIFKLINHSSPKFCSMANRQASIHKVFHTEPVEPIKLDTQLKKWVDEALKIDVSWASTST